MAKEIKDLENVNATSNKEVKTPENEQEKRF